MVENNSRRELENQQHQSLTLPLQYFLPHQQGKNSEQRLIIATQLGRNVRSPTLTVMINNAVCIRILNLKGNLDSICTFLKQITDISRGTGNKGL
mmetsp:Transcript_11218/g.12036  ORF Transcript_11218/g.12036 Transcript_11218/m.12036 type:complete len:95 (-) Transcript_11218:148-432(-)